MFARAQRSERVKTLRSAFKAKQDALSTDRLIFLDESGYRLGATNRYGWGKRGDKVYGYATHADWKTMTLIGAMSIDGVCGFWTVDGTANTDVFSAWVKHELIPNLRTGDVIVMDNLAVHKNKGVKNMLTAAGVSILFLPPYSPDLNPIEKLWSKLKDFIRRCDTTTRLLFDNAVAAALDTITPKDCVGWTTHAGYSIGPIKT